MDGRGTQRGGALRRLGVVALVMAIGAGTAGAGAATPHDVLPTPPYLYAVACQDTSFCIAVGSTQTGAFAARYDGAVWTPTPTPAVTNGALAGVACPSSIDCFAVGSQVPSDKHATLIERWDGSSWQIVSSPNRLGSNALASISCVSASFCVAVGSTESPIGLGSTLVEQWNGSVWKIVSSPNFHSPPNDTSRLSGVSCPTAKQCFAVGETVYIDSYETFIIHWNGRAWSTSARQPSQVAQSIYLTGIACPTATMCWAVGHADTVSIVEKDRWNGSKWKLTEGKTPPNNNYDDRSFSAVSCSSSTACLAVGIELTALPYAQRWNGSSWRQTPRPPRGDWRYGFAGVSCVAADHCYAVGGNVVQEWRPSHWKLLATF
jgi:hypothetical protein